MIQRVQSVYLLLVTILMSWFLFSSYAFFESAGGGSYVLYTYAIKFFSNDSVEVVRRTLPLIIIVILTGIVVFVNIFFFHHRITQIRICVLVVMLLLVQLLLIYYYYTSAGKEFQALHPSMKLPAILPVVSIILVIMAYRGIKQDETLVNSYNRIR